MFGIGKGHKVTDYTPQAKARRRHPIWYWMAFWFVFCIGCLLGINIALLVFASTSVVLLNLLSGMSAGETISYAVSLVISLLLAAAFLVGYMWTFAGASKTYEAARAYEEHFGTWAWPRLLVAGLEVFFILLDLISLSYRRQFFAAKGAEQLFWFFVVLSLLSPIIGLLMHILENKPLDYRLYEARQHGNNLLGDDVFEAIERMPADKRTQVLFDPTGQALSDYFSHEWEEQENARARMEQERVAREQEEARKAQERTQKPQEARRPLAFPSPDNQAS